MTMTLDIPRRRRASRRPASRRPASRRPGFSLPELLISMVVVAVIGAALTKLVLAQNRFYEKQSLQRDARNVSRAALNILNADARMIEESNSIISANDNSVRFRVPWAVGVACGPTTVAILPVDTTIKLESIGQTTDIGVRQANGSFQRVVATGGTPITTITLGALATCTGANVTPVPGSTVYTVPSIGAPTIGTPVIFYRELRYRIADSQMLPGRKGLFRRVGLVGTDEEIVAPLDASSTFQYYTLNNPVPGTAPGSVQQIYGIRFNLIGASERNAGGSSTGEQASLVTSVFFRNRLL
jgi:prepilin-type N-terminal cleavage/methylation domain-containing protein